MKRFVKTLELVDDPDKIAAYCEVHNQIWPEIVSGIKSVGIRTMELWLDGNRAVMIMETDDDLDVPQAMERLAHLPRQQEWEDHVAHYQQCAPGDTSAGKWKEMNRIFTLPE